MQEGNTSLFGIFFLAIYSLVLIPYTIYRLCNPSEEAIKPWEAVGACVESSDIDSLVGRFWHMLATALAAPCLSPGLAVCQGNKRKPSALVSYIRRVGTSTVVSLVVAWAIWVFIVYYVSANAKDLTPFDPFEILGVCAPSDQPKHWRISCLLHMMCPDLIPLTHSGKWMPVHRCAQASVDQRAGLALKSCQLLPATSHIAYYRCPVRPPSRMYPAPTGRWPSNTTQTGTPILKRPSTLQSTSQRPTRL